jgi:hypothetical protein
MQILPRKCASTDASSHAAHEKMTNRTQWYSTSGAGQTGGSGLLLWRNLSYFGVAAMSRRQSGEVQDVRPVVSSSRTLREVD